MGESAPDILPGDADQHGVRTRPINKGRNNSSLVQKRPELDIALSSNPSVTEYGIEVSSTLHEKLNAVSDCDRIILYQIGTLDRIIEFQKVLPDLPCGEVNVPVSMFGKALGHITGPNTLPDLSVTTR